MSNAKKTIINYFEEIRDLLADNGLLSEEHEEFINKRIEVTSKKNASAGGAKKLTPTQVANQGIAQAIYEHLATTGKALSVTEMLKTIPACAVIENNQKINGILMRLYDCEKRPNPNPMFIRIEEKGIARFKANPDYVAETEGEQSPSLLKGGAYDKSTS